MNHLNFYPRVRSASMRLSAEVLRYFTGTLCCLFMRKRKSVALLIETSNAYARGVLEGIMAYVRQHEPWSLHLPEQGRGGRPPAWLSRWSGDGIVARIETPLIARAVKRTRLPVVDVSAARHLPKAPWVETDDAAIAKLAASHLLERGFRHLAYCGDDKFAWSRLRGEHFERHVREANATFSSYRPRARRGGASVGTDRAALSRWLRELPRPVGVLCCYDIQAQHLLDACRGIGVAVPEDIAVLGVDNDPVLCNLTTPPLSSIIPNTRRTGFEAAALLDRMMRGEHVAPEACLIPPVGIETRQSTDVLAIADRDVASALRFIREHACDGIDVQDVLRAVPLSRRVLESRFRAWVGRTPHAEILRIRLDRVKELLLETDLPLERIAALAGFEHSEYMNVAFRRELGPTPGQYRRQLRLAIP
jgi:LacI family transcriptional regulator